MKSGSFHILRHEADSGSCVQTLPKTRLRLWLPIVRNEKVNQFMLAVFSKSVALRTKVPFNV